MSFFIHSASISGCSFSTEAPDTCEFRLSQEIEHGMVFCTMVVPERISTSKAADADRSALWRILMAFGIVYVGYGLNFVAVKIGVESMPAFLFAASHIFCPGVLLHRLAVLHVWP